MNKLWYKVAPTCILIFIAGCHEADKVLYPISQVSEELNATSTHFSLPIGDLPFSDIHFKHHSLVLEKKF